MMDHSFDVELLREFADRQRKDAERIVALCDAVAKMARENETLRAAAAKDAKAASPEKSK